MTMLRDVLLLTCKKFPFLLRLHLCFRIDSPFMRGGGKIYRANTQNVLRDPAGQYIVHYMVTTSYQLDFKTDKYVIAMTLILPTVIIDAN